MTKQKLLPLIGTAFLLFGCNSEGNKNNDWQKIDEVEAYKIRAKILNSIVVPQYVNMTKTYSRTEKYGGSSRINEYSGPRLQISKDDFYMKSVIFEPDDWYPEEGEKPYYCLFTQYHILRGKVLWTLNDKSGIRTKSSREFTTEEAAKAEMMQYMINDAAFNLGAPFDYDVWVVKQVIDKASKDSRYKAELAFKHKVNDEKSLGCEYSYSIPEATKITDASRANNVREFENSYLTYEKGHYEGIDYDKTGFKYDYVEDAEYKATYNEPFEIDQVDPDTWCE